MLQLNQSGNKMTAMIWNVLKTNTESKKSSDAMFPFQDALPLKHAPRWRRASLSCMYQQPSARWWRRRACYKCFSFVIPFCTCFLERKPDGRERSENPEVISRSETSADTGISEVFKARQIRTKQHVRGFLTRTHLPLGQERTSDNSAYLS